MRVGLLGPVELRDGDGALVTLSGARLRALLARLALAPGSLVTSAALVDAVWPDDPPAAPANALQSLVSRLRRVLPADLRLDGRSPGYVLVIDPDQVDVGRFERLAAAGRAAAARGEAGAVGLFTEALDLWRGPVLADLTEARFAGPVAARLSELRLRTVEDRAEIRLAQSASAEHTSAPHASAQHVSAELIGELAELTAAHPLRERARALHMRALRSAGRSAEAVAAFAELRQALAESLGTDPSAELRDLNVELLQADHARVAGNLRAALTSFVGRAAELSRVDEALDAGRLVTLVGPGGAGKTRLAIEVATRRAGRAADGVWLVELAAVTDPAEVAPAVLATLAHRDGRREGTLLGRAEPGQTALDRLAAALRDRQALIVLDNCEHLLDACAEVAAAVLGAGPEIAILATTREPLAITGEALIPVGPFPLPPAELSDVDAALGYAAVRLFADRMAAVRPGLAVTPENLATVIDVCRRLDGLALAIELACARLRTLPLADIATRLSDRFRLLTGGSRTALPRHQTLLAVVGWSWDLFDEAERRLARRLAVFAGGATLAAIEAVCADGEVLDPLSALVDKSFVELSDGELFAHARYRMLDTVRAYAAAELAGAGEADRTRAAHAAYFLSQVERADAALRGADQLSWLAWLESEYDNISAALRWAVDAGEVETAVRFVAGLGWYWVLNGGRDEAAGWLTAALSMATEKVQNQQTLAIAYAFDAIHQFSVHRLDRAAASGAAARDLAGDHAQPHPAVAFVTTIVSLDQFDLATIFAALSRLAEHPEPWLAAAGWLVRGHAAETFGRVAEAGEHFDRARQSFQAVGDRWGAMMAVSALAGCASLRGDHGAAIAAFTEAAALSAAVAASDDAAWARLRRGLEYLRAGDTERARADLSEGRRDALRRRSAVLIAMAEGGLADVARTTGEVDGARALLAQALRRLDGATGALPPRVRVTLLAALARAEVAAGDLTGASLASGFEVATEIGDRPMLAGLAEARAELDLARGEPARAARWLGLAAATRGAVDEGSPEVRATGSAARSVLGEAGWAAAYAQGATLSADAAAAELTRQTAVHGAATAVHT